MKFKKLSKEVKKKVVKRFAKNNLDYKWTTEFIVNQIEETGLEFNEKGETI